MAIFLQQIPESPFQSASADLNFRPSMRRDRSIGQPLASSTPCRKRTVRQPALTQCRKDMVPTVSQCKRTRVSLHLRCLPVIPVATSTPSHHNPQHQSLRTKLQWLDDNVCNIPTGSGFFEMTTCSTDDVTPDFPVPPQLSQNRWFKRFRPSYISKKLQRRFRRH